MSSTGSRIRQRIDATTLEDAVKQGGERISGRKSTDEGNLAIFEVFALWVSSLNVKAETVKEYKRNIRTFLEYTDGLGLESWRDLRLHHLQTYANRLTEQEYSRRYVDLRTVPARSASRWAAANWPESFRDWTAGFKVPKSRIAMTYEDTLEKVHLSFDQIVDLLLWLRERENGWSLIPGLALQGLCGLRLTEALRLPWDRIDLKEGLVTIEGEVKNRFSIRRLPVPGLVLDILRDAPQVDPIRIVPYSERTVYSEQIKKSLQRWNPEVKIVPKDFRKSLPSESLIQGWYGYEVRRYLGHGPADMTEAAYFKQSKVQLIDLLRKRVTYNLDTTLRESRAKWQRNVNDGRIVTLEAVAR